MCYKGRAKAYKLAKDYKNALKDYEFLKKQLPNPCINPQEIKNSISECKAKLEG